MKKLLFVLGMILSVMSSYGQDKKTVTGFDGGMMIHTGYLSDGAAVKGMPYGIGGTARLHLGKHFRAGMEGYVSTLPLMGNGSYIKYGWGGLLGDLFWTFGRWIPYFGLTLGGGSSTSLEMNDFKDGQILGGSFRKQGMMVVDPHIGCEYSVSDALHLTLKLDYLLAPCATTLPRGIRLYFGFIFCH